MNSETRAFLDRVRGADSPSVEDQERVLRALRISTALGLSASVAISSTISARWWSWLLGAGTQFTAIAGCVIVLTLADTVNPNLEGRARTGAQGPSAPLAAASADGTPAATQVVTAQPSFTSSFAAPGSARPSASAPPSPAKRGSATPELATKESPGSPPATSLALELELLGTVQAALQRGDGAAALRALDSHQTLDRQFAAERAAARILALCSAGRIDEAHAAAARFADTHPSSVHGAAIARSCANSKRIRSH